MSRRPVRPLAGAALAGVRNAPAPAKLNLHLHVLGRRSDGYHEIESVFELIDLADTLDFDLREDGQIRRIGRVAGVAAADDLALRAARALKDASGTPLGVDLALAKRIPIGGGMGGGSSDAATTLMVLNRLWSLGWHARQISELALTLGADVPFFVAGGTAYARGVGERLRVLPPTGFWFVVLAPPVSIPTATVFGAPELTRNSKPLKISGSSRLRAGCGSLPGRNDLEPVVLARSPQVARAHQALRQAMLSAGQSAGLVRMTGSGSCVFAALADPETARRVAASVRLLGVGWVAVARSLQVHPLTGWWDKTTN